MKELLQPQIQEQIKEFTLRLEYLEKLILLVQQNTNHNFEYLLACLGLIAAITAVALVYLVKSTVNKKVDEQIESIRTSIKQELKQEMLVELQQYINNKWLINWAESSAFLDKDNKFIIAGLNMSPGTIEHSLYKLHVTSYYENLTFEYELKPQYSNDHVDLVVYLKESYNYDVSWFIIWVNMPKNP